MNEFILFYFMVFYFPALWHEVKLFLHQVVMFMEKKKKIILYEDIPYAEPPIGNLRWKAPKSIQIKQRDISKRK